MVTQFPLETILRNSNATGRVAEWAIELQPFELTFDTTPTKKNRALAEFTAEWTDPGAGEAEPEETQIPGRLSPGRWAMSFYGAFGGEGAGAAAVLTSPTGERLYYAVQLCFPDHIKRSNNIAEYEGLLAGLRAAIALGVKKLIVQGDSQLLVNFSNKTYKAKDEHMAAYLEEVRKLEKNFLGMELSYIPREENRDADEIARRASCREPQRPGVFEERLTRPSASPPDLGEKVLPEDLPPAPDSGAPDCGPSSGDRVVLAASVQDTQWITQLKDFLVSGTLPEDD